MTTLHPFIKSVAAYIHRHSLLRTHGEAKTSVVVALSGGADSVALLAALAEIGLECIAAHCNFHLRGPESMRDMQHCRKIAGELGVDLYVRDFDVHRHCRQTGQSVEMAARQLRYDWFHELLERNYAQAIAVGHHREDQAETVLLNLARGSGIAGAAAMKPRNGLVVRPLLDTTRADIENYLADRRLTFVTDSTNADTDIRRNALRHIVLPAMDNAIPGATDGLARSAAYLGENLALYQNLVAGLRKEYFNGNVLEIGKLAQHPHAGLLAFEWLKEYGFPRVQTDRMLTADTGAVFTSPTGWQVEISRGKAIVTPPSLAVAKEDEYPVSLSHDILQPIHLVVTRHSVTDFFPTRNPNILYLDETVLQDSPHIVLRHWHHGDRMVPFGKDSRKLLSDIFADAALTRRQKDKVWLLERNGAILWVVGVRPSNLFTIGPDTKRYIRIELQ